MAPIVEAVTNVAPAANGVSGAIPVPTGTGLTKLLLAAMTTSGAASTITPAATGWNQLAFDAEPTNNQMSLGVWWRWCTASEPASYTFDLDSSRPYTGVMALISGVAQDVPVYDTGVINWTDLGLTATALSINNPNNGLLLGIFAKRSNANVAITPPTGMTEIIESQSSTSAVMEMEFATLDATSAVASGDKTATFSANSSGGGILVSFQPVITTVRLAPTEIVSMTNLSGTVDRIQDDPTVGDALWLTYP